MPQPNNPFRAERERRAQATTGDNPFRAERERRAATPSANYAAREMAARRIMDNLLAVPSASGILLADAVNLGRAGVEHAAAIGVNNARSLVGMDRKPGPTFGERFAEKTANEGLVQRAARNIPRPTAEGVNAAIESAPSLLPGGESPSEAMARERDEYAQEEFDMRQAHPIASGVGDVGGDVLSLIIGRRSVGADKLLRGVETRLAGRASTEAARNTAETLAKALKSPSMQRLARGAGRSVETGVEAAVLDILKDPNADPIETAAVAAGGQLVGSGFLAGTQGLVSGGPMRATTKLTLAAVSTMTLVHLLKSATPGGEDRILESIETGYDKVVLGVALGAASAAIGATRYGRGNTNLDEQSRALLDGVATVHRGTTLSLLTDWTEGDDKDRATIERVLTAISEDPSYRGKNDAERAILRRLNDGAALGGEQRYKTGGEF